MENVKGGAGEVFIEYLIGEEEFKGMGRLFAKYTLPKGSSFGYHVHQGDSETYYVISGTGKYTGFKGDEKTEAIVSAGDVVYTPDGEGHTLENIGDEDLVLIILVLFNEQHK